MGVDTFPKHTKTSLLAITIQYFLVSLSKFWQIFLILKLAKLVEFTLEKTFFFQNFPNFLVEKFLGKFHRDLH
jgi:hypothetical protein